MDVTLTPFEGPCVVVQSDTDGQPVILLRMTPDREVERLTIEQAHQRLEDYDLNYDPENEVWWDALYDLLQGIR